MATTTKKPAKKMPARTKKHTDEATTVEFLQRAIEDLDQARSHAGHDMRAAIDSAMERMKDLVADFRKRAEDEASDWQKTIAETTEDMRREFARRAVRAQQTPDALSELAAEIKKRNAELAR